MAQEAASWRDLERGAPEIARLGLARITATRVCLLGTLRRDGSPRISPVEPYIVSGELLVGAMAWSQKAADLRRDPRCVVHSTVTGPDSGEGELKVDAFASRAGTALRQLAKGAWWWQFPDRVRVYSLQIKGAVFVEWDLVSCLGDSC